MVALARSGARVTVDVGNHRAAPPKAARGEFDALARASEGHQRHEGQRMGRHYTPEERERAIVQLYQLGTFAAVERASAIPESTVRTWANAKPEDELADIRASIRAGIVRSAWACLGQCLERAAEQSMLPGIGIKDCVEIAERVSRVLKNIGSVAEKLEVTAKVSHASRKPLHERIQETADKIEAELRRRGIRVKRAGDGAGQQSNTDKPMIGE